MDSTSAIGNRQSKIGNIILIGYRGTGKSAVARLLAEQLGWEAVDADEVLEIRYGRNIRTIFADEGETGFRDKESAILEEICRGNNQVLATGGGAGLRAEHRRRLRSAGWVGWLTASPAITWQRHRGDAGTAQRRPDLSVGGLAEIEELLRQREPLYRECADITIETAGRSPEEIAEAIFK